MSLWKIAWRSIQLRALSSGLTAFSISLGVALVVAVLVIHGTIDRAFRRGSQGYDLIVGAKGGQLPLVLGTVYYLQLNQQLESIPYSMYEELTTGRFADAVAKADKAGVKRLAIPLCLGHDYQGCPAVATVPEMFEYLTYGDNRKYEFSAGRNMAADKPFEAVIGPMAAQRTGLKIGDKFRPVATAPEGGPHGGEGHEAFTIVGILAPTGTPNDRAIFTNLEGFFLCPAHKQAPSAGERELQAAPGAGAKPPAADEHHNEHEHEHEHARALTAILVATNMDERPQMAMALADVINRESTAQAVKPAMVIADFFDRIVGNVQLLLLVLAILVVVVAGIGILVSIYNSMSDRRHDIAVMRALGASRMIVMSVILLESILLALGGGLAGLLLGHGLTGLLAPTIADQTGVIVSALEFQAVELILVPGLIVLATLVGYLPAVAAYRTDVAKSLQAGT